jgi:hypothetical protein
MSPMGLYLVYGKVLDVGLYLVYGECRRVNVCQPSNIVPGLFPVFDLNIPKHKIK